MATRKRAKAQGKAHRFGGDWTATKLTILGDYLHAYTTALKKAPFKTAYIDAFAGTGYRTQTNARDRVVDEEGHEERRGKPRRSFFVVRGVGAQEGEGGLSLSMLRERGPRRFTALLTAEVGREPRPFCTRNQEAEIDDGSTV